MNKFSALSPEEKKLYFVQTANLMKVAPMIVEKDFWVCFTLEKLFSLPQIGETLIFKGGTTLSKVYNLIHRFSEDIDISVNRESLCDQSCDPAEIGIGTKERKRRLFRLKTLCQEKIHNEIKPLLEKSISKDIKNGESWLIEEDVSDPDGQTLNFKYPSVLINKKDNYIKPMVKIEMGARSDHWPSEEKLVTPYVAERFLQPFEKPFAKVKVLAVERTFWEKATLLHAEYHRPLEKKMSPRLSRHYYDVAMMIKAKVVTPDFSEDDLLKKVAEHKQIFFQCGWAKYNEAKKGGLHLFPNLERLAELEADYRKMSEMFFIEPINFNEMIKIIKGWEGSFNK